MMNFQTWLLETVNDKFIQRILSALPQGVRVDQIDDGPIPKYRIHIDADTYLNVGSDIHLIHDGVLIDSLKNIHLLDQKEVLSFIKKLS